MKIRLLLLLLLITSTLTFSQSKDELAAKEFFWGANDPYKNITTIPDKWKNESAVVIYKNENYDFHKFGKNVTYTTSVRKRIKLLDKASVEEFSEFSFTKRFRSTKGRYSWREKGNNFVGVKVIKSNGSEIEIDVEKEAVEVDGETKVAIPNLEVGDIIDYYSNTIEPFKSTYAFGFDPVESTLAEDYPIMEYKLFFKTENDFFINFNSYNGAPELKEIVTEKKSFRNYELVANDIQKNEYPRWFYPLVELPSYKFQVYFARSGSFEDRAMAFLPEKENIIKKSVSKQEVLDLYESRFKPDGDIGDIKDFFKGKSYASQEEKVSEAYYYMRHYYLTRFIEAFYVQDAKITYNPFLVYGNYPVFIQNQKQFIRHFTEFLKREKIGYEIVIAKKRFDGDISDLLIESNVQVLVKVLTPTPMYASYFGVHTNINEYSALIEGTDVYLLSATKSKFDVINEGKLPSSIYSDNESKKVISLKLNDDFSSFNLNTVSSFKGFEKEAQLGERLSYTDYVNEDYKKYGTESYLELVRNKKLKAQQKKEIDALNDKLKERQKERFKNSVQDEYAVKEAEDYTYSIDETGRYGLDTYFTFSESFKAKADDLLKKAGSNYILEIGKLIGGQIDLTDKERQRKENIHMEYPRCYNYQIRFTIPAGYSVSGLEKLNKSVDNSTGAFISKATIEGDKLVINTSKQYKNNYEPNSNWPLMIAFLDEANQFTNEKILLKKE